MLLRGRIQETPEGRPPAPSGQVYDRNVLRARTPPRRFLAVL